MNVSEFLSPLIAVNSDGYRQVRPNQGEGQRNLISARVRMLLSHALGVKKFRYTPYRNMPKDVITEGGSEGQKKQERIHPEVRYIGVQMGVQFGRAPETSRTDLWRSSMGNSRTGTNGTMWRDGRRVLEHQCSEPDCSKLVLISTMGTPTIPALISMLWMIK